MTSTSFNIGISSSDKNSSRVIKPPGGGHTDIFGISNNEVTQSSKKNVPPAAITSCFLYEENKKLVATENANMWQTKELEEKMFEPHDNNKTDENTQPDQSEKNKTAATRRQRVPPGGFSTGFW